MDIKDVRLGMLVQLNTPCMQGVGTVELISDPSLVQVRLDGVVTDSTHNTDTIKNRFRTDAKYFTPYQDPEADMIVWDALEVGEHFYMYGDVEYIKISKTQASPLGEHYIHQFSHLFSPHKKVSLVPTK